MASGIPYARRYTGCVAFALGFVVIALFSVTWLMVFTVFCLLLRFPLSDALGQLPSIGYGSLLSG